MTPPPVYAAWTRGKSLLAAGTIAAAAVVAYANSFRVPLLFDDGPAITQNPTIRDLGRLGEVLSPPASSGPSGRPLLNLTFALNYAAGGENVLGYHLVNLALHILAALVLFGIVNRLLRRRWNADPSPRPDRLHPTLLALAIALIWAVHPLQTESVTYISERAEILMGLFYLLAVYAFVRAAEDSGGPAGRWLGLSLACCWLGMAAKEVMVTAPLMILICDSIFFAGNPKSAFRLRWPYYVGLAASWGFLGWIMLTRSKHSIGFEQGVGTWEYALTECEAVVHYLQLSLWPHPLVFDYGPVLATRLLKVLPYALALALGLAAAAVTLWRAPAGGFLGVWFFLILAPTSSVVPVALQPIAENRPYLPLAAVIAAGLLAAHRWLGPRIRWLALALALAAIGGTLARNRDYRDELSIWGDTVAKRPHSPRAQTNYADALAHAGRLDEAIGHFRLALQLTPGIARIHFNLAKALHDRGRSDESIREYQAALRLEPSYADAQRALASALAESGQGEQAQALLRQAVKLNPGDAQNHYNLGMVLFRGGQLEESAREFERALELQPAAIEPRDALGTALFRLGRPDEAARQYEQVLKTNPNYVPTLNNLGNLLFAGDRAEEARQQFERVLQIKPDDSAAHTSLGMVELQLGEVEKAKGHFEAALRLNPADAEAHFRRGNILAMGGRIPEAMAEWQESLRLRPDDAEAHNNLATALSQTGKIPEAIREYEWALQIDPGYQRARANLADLQTRLKSAGGDK